jgi:hypothetical protein
MYALRPSEVRWKEHCLPGRPSALWGLALWPQRSFEGKAVWTLQASARRSRVAEQRRRALCLDSTNPHRNTHYRHVLH